MTRLRVSIARLMVVVGLIAVGIAALRSPSQLWASGLYSLALAAFTIAVLAIAYRRREKRAFWVGFLVCGGVHMFLMFGPWRESPIRLPLVTTGVLELLYPWFVPPQNPAAAPPPAGLPGGGNPSAMLRLGRTHARIIRTGGFRAPVPANPWETWMAVERDAGTGEMIGYVVLASPEPFRWIGQSLFSLLFAWLGGYLARHLYLTRDRTE